MSLSGYAFVQPNFDILRFPLPSDQTGHRRTGPPLLRPYTTSRSIPTESSGRDCPRKSSSASVACNVVPPELRLVTTAPLRSRLSEWLYCKAPILSRH